MVSTTNDDSGSQWMVSSSQSRATDLQIIQSGNVDFEHILYTASPKPPQPVYPDILAPPCGFGAKTYEIFCEIMGQKREKKKREIATQLSVGSNVHRKRWPSNVESDVWEFLKGLHRT